MAKRAKEKIKVNKPNKIKNSNKVIEKSTKDEKINFDEEIFIGLKRLDEDKPKVAQKTDKNIKKKVQKQDKTENVKADEKKANQEVKKNIKPARKKPVKKKLTPKQELAKKKRQAIFRVVKCVTLLGIIIGGIIYTLLSPIFNIKTISILGNSRISIDEIIGLSGLQLEQNIFKYRNKDVINQIKENAYIDSVKIRRKIPDTVEITIEERKATFMIQFANAYAFINNQGYILEISDTKEKLPIITGIQTIQEEIQTGNRFCTEDLKKLGDVLKIMESSQSNGVYEYITKIDITDSDNYVLTLKEKKKVVHLGDTSNLSTKMLWILKFNELEGNTQGEIILNMNLNDESSKPYFRKKV